jgi:protease-4
MRRIAALCILLLLGGCAIVRLPGSGGEGVREVTLQGDGPDKVLLLEVSGVLSFRRPWAPPGFPRGESLPTRLRADLDRARKDPRVRALLLRIDSPGGTVSSSDVLHHEILAFRKETGVPVVALIVEKGLSGGYYTALAADEIVALPTALVGSVGVFVAKFDASGLLERWGVRSEITKSGPQKDLLSPLRPLSDEERQTLDGIVGDLRDRFVATLKASRPALTEADLAAVATAAPFSATRALELHLVDRLAYPDDAFRLALERAGLERGRLVAYRASEPEGGGPYALWALASLLGQGPAFLDPSWVEEALGAEVSY